MEAQKEFKITGPYITLGQLLKEEGIIPTGGAAKWFLKEHVVMINGTADDRRGRKLQAGDRVEIPGIEQVQIKGQ